MMSFYMILTRLIHTCMTPFQLRNKIKRGDGYE